MEQLKRNLLASLADLAHTVEKKPKTANTDRVFLHGLRVSASDTVTRMELVEEIFAVRGEKDKVAPGCAACTSRCGLSDEFDFSTLDRADPEIARIKWALIEKAQSLSACPSEASVAFCYEAMGDLPKERTIEELQMLLQQADGLI